MANKGTDRDFTIPKQTTIVKVENFKYYVKVLNKVYENGDIGGTWVTDVEYYPKKVFHYEKGKKAYEFHTLSEALDFTYALAWNGYSAVVETVPSWTGNIEKYLTNSGSEEGKA